MVERNRNILRTALPSAPCTGLEMKKEAVILPFEEKKDSARVTQRIFAFEGSDLGANVLHQRNGTMRVLVIRFNEPPPTDRWRSIGAPDIDEAFTSGVPDFVQMRGSEGNEVPMETNGPDYKPDGALILQTEEQVQAILRKIAMHVENQEEEE